MNTTNSIMKKPSAKSEFNRWWRCIELAREQLLEEGRDPYNISSADFGRTFPRAEKFLRKAKGDGVRLLTASQRTGGWHGRQPVFFMVFHASMALCRSIRRWVIGTGGLGGFQL